MPCRSHDHEKASGSDRSRSRRVGSFSTAEELRTCRHFEVDFVSRFLQASGPPGPLLLLPVNQTCARGMPGDSGKRVLMCRAAKRTAHDSTISCSLYHQCVRACFYPRIQRPPESGPVHVERWLVFGWRLCRSLLSFVGRNVCPTARRQASCLSLRLPAGSARNLPCS